jgi:small nuclear ribonucleoprotein F
MEYHGRLSSVDSYMNIKLTNTEEWKDGKNEGTLGEVFIRYDLDLGLFNLRCNNVLWISENTGQYDEDRMQD